jgi:hypothetical protein
MFDHFTAIFAAQKTISAQAGIDVLYWFQASPAQLEILPPGLIEDQI